MQAITRPSRPRTGTIASPVSHSGCARSSAFTLKVPQPGRQTIGLMPRYIEHELWKIAVEIERIGLMVS